MGRYFAVMAEGDHFTLEELNVYIQEAQRQGFRPDSNVQIHRDPHLETGKLVIREIG